MPKSALTVLLFCVLVTGVVQGTVSVDVSQTDYNWMEDLPTNPDYAQPQTFVATMNADLVGVRLLIEGDKWAGDYPFGSDVIVTLHGVDASGDLGGMLSSGYLPKDDILYGQPQWFDIMFASSLSSIHRSDLGVCHWLQQSGRQRRVE